MTNKQNRGSGRWGYYMALGLCAAVIALGGYLYTLEQGEPQLQDPDQTVNATADGQDLPVVATKPQEGPVLEDLNPTTQPTAPKATEPKPLQTAYPLEGQTVAVYAMDRLEYNQTTRDWRTHDGLDLGADAGTKVCAAAEGTVYSVYEDDTLGMTVVIRHQDGYVTQYSSLDQEVLVEPGDTVTLGQAIGTVGSTALLETALGPHVHFAVTLDGEPLDPADFFALS